MLIPTLPGYFAWLFGGSLLIYLFVMIRIGQLAQRRIHNVEDYVLAGRTLNTGLVTIAMIATWFGAESLMTTTDEVSQLGVRGGMLDPLGIALCLLLAGLFVAKPLWRSGLMTIPDFFRQRYGRGAETLSALVLVPSYFGWIAAQYLALGIILQQFFQVPLSLGVVSIAVLATSYSLMGGMWSVMWTDTLQLAFICLGLMILGAEILWSLGQGSIMAGASALWFETPTARWRIDGDGKSLEPLMAALSALAIGSLGNLPIQDLMQRICASNSAQTACRGCILGGIGYLSVGLLPMMAGLAASRILTDVPSEGVLMQMAVHLLNPLLLLLFLLAVVSAVLSTVVSAVLAPASVLAQNLVQPMIDRWALPHSDARALAIQRGSAIAIVIASVALALSGSDAYSLVEASYSLSFVSLFAPFVVGLYCSRLPAVAAWGSIAAGVGSWLWHSVWRWDMFAQPLTSGLSEHRFCGFLAWLPHELGDAGLSTVVFCGFWAIVTLSKTRNTVRGAECANESSNSSQNIG